jgi:hypothetical protein
LTQRRKPKETVGGTRTGEKGRKTIPSAGGVRYETDNAVQSASGWERVEAGEKKEERGKKKKQKNIMARRPAIRDR